MKILKKIGLRTIIPISVLFIFIIFSSILYYFFTKYYFENMIKQSVKDNEYSAKVVMDYIEDGKEQLKEKAKIGAEDEILFNGIANDIYIDLTKKIGIDKVNIGKMNRIRYLKTANNINARIFGSSSHLYLENLIEIFDAKGKQIASVGGLSKNYGDSIEDEYIKYTLDDTFKTKRDLSTIVKKSDMYFLKGLETIYLDKNYGVVVVSKPFDLLYLKKISKFVNKDIAIIEKNNIFLSTLNNKEGIIKNFEIKDYDKINNEKAIKKTIITTEIKIEDKEYLITIIPIKNYKNEIVLEIGIMTDLENLKSIKKESNKKFLIGMFLFLAVISLLTGIILNYILKPLKIIINGIEKIKEGDYSHKIKGNFDKDLGIIAESVKELSEAIEKRENAIKEQNEKLLELDKLKDEFLANTSHELRTPLNGIIGLADSMINGSTGDINIETLANLELIVSSGKRLEKLVNDILDFSKLKNKDIELRLETLSIKKIIDNVIIVFSMLVVEKNIIIENKIDKNDNFVYCDENRVEQILYNLIGNAIKFTEKGTITLSVEEKDDYMEISIKDTGIGIPENKISDIFNSFEQVDGSISKKYGGTGLGLSITKKLIELHGGKIWVKSKLNYGSEFIFTLPKSKENIAINEKVINESKKYFELKNSFVKNVSYKIENEKTRKIFKILIVDDEYTNLIVLENYLKVYSYEIEKAMSGKEAIEIINKSKKWEYSLVILDVMMPQISGYEVCAKIREKYSLYELPVLMLTAKFRKEDIVIGFENGANDYLKKPVEREELLARVDTLVSLTNAVKQLIQKTKEYEQEKNQRNISEKLTEKLKKIEKLISHIYLENDYISVIEYIINIILENEENYFLGGMYYKYIEKNKKLKFIKEKTLILDKTQKKYPEELNLDEYDILKKALFENKIQINCKENIKNIELDNYNIYPIVYNNNFYGIFIFEINENINKDNSEAIEEVMKLLSSNIGVYFENIRLKDFSLKNEKLASITELSKAIVHELRTPLAGIKGFASMGINKLDKVTQKDNNCNKILDYLKKILEESNRVDKMAKDLIEYSVLEEKELNKEKTSLKNIIESVLEYMKEEFEINEIKIEKNMEEISIEIDRIMIEKALNNILKNSIEAVDFNKSEHYIKIDIKKENEIIKLEIKDNGVGIDKKIIEKIYEPLISTKIQGTGLGLSIIKKIIEKHKGKIEIESEKDLYTKVTIELGEY